EEAAKDEELGAVDAVALRQVGCNRGIRAVRDPGPVAIGGLDLAKDRVGASLQVDDETIDVMRSRSVVEPVALEYEPAARHVLRTVVWRRARQRRADALRIVRQARRNGADPGQVH